MTPCINPPVIPLNSQVHLKTYAIIFNLSAKLSIKNNLSESNSILWMKKKQSPVIITYTTTFSISHTV